VESFRSAIETAFSHLTEHPEAAVATDAAATAVREEGLRFRVEGPKGDVITDMSKTVGGDATAPTPGWLLRAALASCDATAVAMEAARHGVELTDLTVQWTANPISAAFSESMTQSVPVHLQSGYASGWQQATPLRISCAR
jgi:organic hydroperoxide reductase OsmC/OhrA